LSMNLAFRFLYRCYRFITWSTYWTKRRFTLAGQAMLGGVLVAMFSGLDVENAVGYQAFTTQLRTYLDYAEQNGMKLVLWVRESTKLSGPLQDAVAAGRIEIKFISQ